MPRQSRAHDLPNKTARNKLTNMQCTEQTCTEHASTDLHALSMQVKWWRFWISTNWDRLLDVCFCQLANQLPHHSQVSLVFPWNSSTDGTCFSNNELVWGHLSCIVLQMWAFASMLCVSSAASSTCISPSSSHHLASHLPHPHHPHLKMFEDASPSPLHQGRFGASCLLALMPSQWL